MERMEDEIWREPEDPEDGFGEDWLSVAPAAVEGQPQAQEAAPMAAAAAAGRPQGRQEQRQLRKRDREQAMAAEAELAQRSGDQSKQQRVESQLEFIATHRNKNTTATYASAWRQFARWVSEVENVRRKEGEQMDVERPEEAEVAAYMRYVVVVKGSPISSMNGALAAIVDHLKYTLSANYNPCQGKLVEAMRQVLVPLARPAEQKKEMDWSLLERIARVARTQTEQGTDDRERWRATRDRCMFMLAYYCLLRGSEVARMKRKDISFRIEHLEPDEPPTKVMAVHVDRLSETIGA